MKHIGLLIFSVVMAFTQAQAQNKQQKEEMAFTKNEEGLVFHDFGSIVYGANGKVDFVFTNKGTKPLVVSEVKSSCGCAVPTWPKEPVEPGKTGTISVVYDTKIAGTFNKTIEVLSNANNSPVRISIRGKVAAQPSDIKAQNAPAANQVKKVEVDEQIPMDSASRANAEKTMKAQQAAQQESFKKLMEQQAAGQKPAKVKVAEPVTVPAEQHYYSTPVKPQKKK